MTYEKLLEALKRLSPEQLAQNVTVYSQVAEEYYPVKSMLEEHNTDVLDNGHKYLVIDG